MATKITKEQITNLKKICNKKVSHHRKLAGHFETEYRINTTEYEKIILDKLELYKKLYKDFYNKELPSINTQVVWVNYMKAGDFNPPHIHTGCRFSSVLFLKVPKQLQEEADRFKGTSESPGSLAFIYGEHQPRDLNTMWAPMPKEGDMFIFPSFVSHWVYPFKSKNVERVSVAANYD